MCEHFQSTLDKLVEMEKEPLAVGDYTVHLNTELSMVDGKMVDILMGDSGSFCHYTTATYPKMMQMLRFWPDVGDLGGSRWWRSEI